MVEYIQSITWQAWAFMGMCAVWLPFFILVATGRLNKARKIAPKKE